VIRLYAFARHPGPALPDVPGLFEVPFDGLAAFCGPATDDDREATPEALWRHEEVVEALMRDRDILPARFGTRVADEADAVRAGTARADGLRSALAHVSGAVELSLRVRAREPAGGPDLHQRLVSLARDAVTAPVDGDGEVLRAAYLVDRGRVGEFQAAVARLQADHQDLGLLLTGPWPPYSFTGARA